MLSTLLETLLTAIFGGNTLYIRIRHDQLQLLHVESGETMEEPPLVAIKTQNGKHEIVAVGRTALACKGRRDIQIANGFEHPRTLLADFTMASIV